MAPATTGLYAVLLAVMMVGLTAHVIMARTKAKISILDGGNVTLAEAMRRHGNFTEAVPMALLLMALAELLGANGTWLHTAGIALVVGRVLHPFGIKFDRPANALRIMGASATLFAILIAAGGIAAQIWTR